MAITPPYNDIEMKTAWAEDAATTIPSVPVPGVAYRNTNIGEETIAQGQQYDSIGRSADWNQLLFKISANIVTMQKGGASLLWISGRNYEQGALVKDPNNAQIYYRLKAGAGTTRPSSDRTNWQLLQEFFIGEGLSIINNAINWGNTTGQTNNDCNELLEAGIYRVETGTENTPTDIESGSGFRGFIYVVRFGSTTQQIAYEVNTSGAFSMNTRLTANSGSTWTAWTRFGVEFTLDWRKGGDYRAGDLVRDTSNSLLYVCTTAVTNSTQRPGLDSTHFQLLQSWLIGPGLNIINNKIDWGLWKSSSEDPDTITEPGIYRLTSSSEHNPVPSNIFKLMVVFANGYNTGSGARITQVCFSVDGTVCSRESTSIQEGANEWTDWKYASKFDSLDFVSGQTYNQGQLVRGSNNVHYVKKTAASVCNTEPNSDSTNFESLAANLQGEGIRVGSDNKLYTFYKTAPNTSDCNECIVPGVYYTIANDDGSYLNAPVQSSGIMLVVTNSTAAPTLSSTSHVRQLYITTDNIYVRTSTSMGSSQEPNWNPWHMVGPDPVSASDLAGNGLTAASNKLNWGTASNVTNANNVTTPGTYALTSSSTNTPTKNGIMFVVKKSDGTVSQIIFDANTGQIFQRDNPDSTWGTWYTQSTSIGINNSIRTSRSFNTAYTAETDLWIRMGAWANWRSNTNGNLYVDNTDTFANHTGQYGSGGQSSGVETTIFIKAGSTFKCNQGSLQGLYTWPAN